MIFEPVRRIEKRLRPGKDLSLPRHSFWLKYHSAVHRMSFARSFKQKLRRKPRQSPLPVRPFAEIMPSPPSLATHLVFGFRFSGFRPTRFSARENFYRASLDIPPPAWLIIPRESSAVLQLHL